MLPTDITRIQPCLSAGRYVLSALLIGSLSPWLWDLTDWELWAFVSLMPNVRVYFWELKTPLPRDACSVIISENKALENILPAWCQMISQVFFTGSWGGVWLFNNFVPWCFALWAFTFFVGCRSCRTSPWFWCHFWATLHLGIIRISVLLPAPLLFWAHLFLSSTFWQSSFQLWSCLLSQSSACWCSVLINIFWFCGHGFGDYSRQNIQNFVPKLNLGPSLMEENISPLQPL